MEDRRSDMSWWSDGERCDEYDYPWCENCKGTESKAQCDACCKAHTAVDEEEEPIEEELAPLPAEYEAFLKVAHKRRRR